MRGGERYYVENQYHKLMDGPGVYPFSLEQGIYLVKQPGDVVCRLRPELPDGGIPNDSFLVVRTAALQELETRISDLEKPEAKPISTKERNNLLVIIGALVEMADLDIPSRPRPPESLRAYFIPAVQRDLSSEQSKITSNAAVRYMAPGSKTQAQTDRLRNCVFALRNCANHRSERGHVGAHQEERAT